MKIFFKISVIFFVIMTAVTSALSQPRFDEEPPFHRKPPREEIDKIRKQKLMDALDISEEKADKFFELFEKNMQVLRSLNKQKRELLRNTEENITSENMDSQLEKLLEIESKMDEQRRNYYTDLKQIFTSKQILQTIIFQRKFMQELRKEISKQKRKRPKDR